VLGFGFHNPLKLAEPKTNNARRANDTIVDRF